jgi:hypothetical protein
VRPAEVEEDAESASFDVEVVRCLGVGRRLLRRLAVTLGGRDARRAAGLSSVEVLPESSATAVTRRLDAGVLDLTCGEDAGVNRMGSLPLAGVAGDASERAGRSCDGVVEERSDGGGESAAERLSGLFVGRAERLPEPRRDGSGDSESLR